MNDVVRLQAKLSILDQIPIFTNLPGYDKNFIASLSSIVEYKRGDIIYKEGDGPDAFYSIITGRLRVYITKGGVEEDLEYLKRGSYFGIISILTGDPHSVAVQAVNDSVIIRIAKDDFSEILRRMPELAIHFSRTLSRRLKRKDVNEKRIFESTIISIFGISDRIGTTNYCLNLGVSLKAQTGKKVLIIDVNRTGAGVASLLGASGNIRRLTLDTPFFSENVISDSILHHSLGLGIINVAYSSGGESQLISLLSYLTTYYHYILVDLQSGLDNVIFELLKQSDQVHIISPSDEINLRATAGLIKDLKASPAVAVGHKIKVLTSEYGSEYPLPFEKRKAMLGHEIYATLPDITSAPYKIDVARIPSIIEYPDSEYSRMIRRISREIGDCLVGLALGSGAALGLAHVGILKAIESNNIPIDILAGTSMGALIGALWASGKSAQDIEDIMSPFRRKIATLRLLDLTIPKKGLIKGREVKRFLVSQFHDKTFHDLKLPFKVVACDILTREEVVIDEGNLADAVMASVAIPGIFEPVKIGDRLLVDGGIINPLPTNVLVMAGVAKIIGVNTLPSPEDIQKSKKKLANIFDFIVNSVQASEYLLAEASCQIADIAMHPVLPTVDWYEFYESSAVIRRGEEEAMRYIDRLKELVREP